MKKSESPSGASGSVNDGVLHAQRKSMLYPIVICACGTQLNEVALWSENLRNHNVNASPVIFLAERLLAGKTNNW